MVDDGSKDGTREILDNVHRDWAGCFCRLGVSEDRLKEARIKVLFNSANFGKGYSLRRGIEETTGDIIIIQDADLEYDPNDYQRMINPILNGKADVVYGSRFLGQERRIHLFWHQVGNQILTFFSNALTNLNLTDVETCYKAFRADVLKELKLKSNRFGIEPEITAKIARLNLRIYEVPISYYGRSYDEGKKIGFIDGIEALYSIIRFSIFDDQFVKGGIVEETLSKMKSMQRFNRHLYQTISPYLGKKILEVGAGTGNITRLLLARAEVVATDINSRSVAKLKDMFENQSGFSAYVWDATLPMPQEIAEKDFDTVVCLNVLEHIEDHISALKNMRSALKHMDGRLVLLVPAYPSLYGSLDKGLGHFRRYNQETLMRCLIEAGFAVEKMFYFNLLGLAGWFLNGKMLKRERLPMGQLKLYEMISPIVLTLEKNIPLPFGLSIVAIGKPV